MAVAISARQEVRVRFGRDDRFVEQPTSAPWGKKEPWMPQLCRLDRSAAQWRDLRFTLRATNLVPVFLGQQLLELWSGTQSRKILIFNQAFAIFEAFVHSLT